MPSKKKPDGRLPIKLTWGQRKILADADPALGNRLKLDEPNQRVIELTVAELTAIKANAETAVQKARTGNERRPLKLLLKTTGQALAQAQRRSVADTVYQFKITLRESQPPIWRRIQVKDCTLDKLHEHIQTVMGWTNSHLHHFKIGEQYFGDPMLMQETFDEMGYVDSTTSNLSDIIPENRKKFRFDYEYDFGDSWHHEILWEGCPKEEPGKKYPLCVEGERACPPEDCGGIWGYPGFIEAIENPEHERHEELLEWIGGSFDPETFDPAAATKAMKKGLGDWRREAGW